MVYAAHTTPIGCNHRRPDDDGPCGPGPDRLQWEKAVKDASAGIIEHLAPEHPSVLFYRCRTRPTLTLASRILHLHIFDIFVFIIPDRMTPGLFPISQEFLLWVSYG